jgi:hypothetical protein
MMVYFYFVFFYLCIFLFGGDDQRLKKTFKIKKQLHEFEINLKFVLFMNILVSTWILVENFS